MTSPHHANARHASHQPGRARAVALTIAGAALWGTTGTSQALLPGHPSPVAVGGLRALIAGTALLVLALFRGTSWLRQVFGRRRLGWLALAGLGVAGYQLTFFAAVSRAGVAVGTLVMLATAPAVAGLAGWGRTGIRPSRAWLVATLVGLSGAALLVLGAGSVASPDAMGLALAVAAGGFFATYTVASRELVVEGLDPIALTASIFLVAGAILIGPLLGQDLSFVSQPRSLWVLAWLGLAATAGAYMLYQLGMRRVDAAQAATFALAEPMVANLLAVLVLREPFTAVMGLGLVLVLAGLGLLGRA